MVFAFSLCAALAACGGSAGAGDQPAGNRNTTSLGQGGNLSSADDGARHPNVGMQVAVPADFSASAGGAGASNGSTGNSVPAIDPNTPPNPDPRVPNPAS